MNLGSKWLRLAKIQHICGVGGYKRTCKGLFAEVANRLPKLDPNSPADAGVLQYRRGIAPVIMIQIEATSINLLQEGS